MTNKIQKLIEKCKSIIPLEGRILIHPLKLKTYKETQVFPTGIPYPEDEKKLAKEIEEVDNLLEGEGLPERETPLVQTEEKEIEISKRFQEAIILRLPENETRFNVGDTIIYNVGSIFEFDFIKEVSVIYKYDPVALIKVEVESKPSTTEEPNKTWAGDDSDPSVSEKFPTKTDWKEPY